MPMPRDKRLSVCELLSHGEKKYTTSLARTVPTQLGGKKLAPALRKNKT
jgi:hypothetical protein